VRKLTAFDHRPDFTLGVSRPRGHARVRVRSGESLPLRVATAPVHATALRVRLRKDHGLPAGYHVS
jgi:hypothetical protein